MTRNTVEIIATELPSGEKCLGHRQTGCPFDTIRAVSDQIEDIEEYDDDELVAVVEYTGTNEIVAVELE